MPLIIHRAGTFMCQKVDTSFHSKAKHTCMSHSPLSPTSNHQTDTRQRLSWEYQHCTALADSTIQLVWTGTRVCAPCHCTEGNVYNTGSQTFKHLLASSSRAWAGCSPTHSPQPCTICSRTEQKSLVVYSHTKSFISYFPFHRRQSAGHCG